LLLRVGLSNDATVITEEEAAGEALVVALER
jgi:hypothetical protein